MTRVSCPACRLRFPAAASHLTTCPECGRHLQAVASAEDTLGYRLFVATDEPLAPPSAAEMALLIEVDPPELP
jgi:predicted anti-sigma-YlaC factor YlaD